MQKATIPDETIDTLFNRTHHRTPTPQPAAGLVGRQACAVCGLRTNTLICKECAEQPEASRARVRRELASILAGMDEAIVEFDDHTPAYRPYWNSIQNAQIKVDAGEMTQADFNARLAAHRAEGGSWRIIIELMEARDRTLQPLNIERARLEKALEVLEGL